MTNPAHPEPEELIALQERRLAGDREDVVRRHVEICPSCREEIERLNAFDDDGHPPASPVPAPPDAETERSWRRFRRRAGGVRRPPGRWRIWWLLGACAAFALFGALYLVQAQRQAGEAETAGFDHPFWLDLIPDDTPPVRGRARDPGTVVAVPATTDVFVVRLLTGDQTVRRGYSARLVDGHGDTVWSRAALQRQDSGAFVLLIPRSRLPAGDYRLLLLAEGSDGGEADDGIASYSFRLRDAA